MTLSDLDFTLPPELIAQNPVEPRDAARLLVYTRATASIAHMHVRDVPSLLPPTTAIVVNSSRVRRGRLQARRSDGRTVELLVLSPCGEGIFECMVGGKGLKPGDQLRLKNDTIITINSPHTEANFTSFLIDFHQSTEEAEQLIETLGSTPLPPYITESTAPDARYQTVFADTLGSAAAPTAGLHFTPELIQKLVEAGNSWHEVLLHVGMGTFQPLRSEEVTANELHFEETEVTPETAEALQTAKAMDRPILAVGTTTCRTLESHARSGSIESGKDRTNLFIYPGFEFNAVNMLFTNFHLPKSSLLLLVSAFLSAEPKEALEQLHYLYSEAIKHQYRFFSFGDAMLIR